ncbi:MAG: response regulator transcription factor [Kiritimatiellae bacterium]|nr:response regulator transcription factor [Kiritimatiellia bacterium]
MSDAKKTRIVMIDDHAVMRMGIKYALSFVPDIEFAGEYDGGDGAAKWVMEQNPDVILLDIRMPDKNGLEVLSEIMLVRPKSNVLMLTTSAADEDIYRSLNLGAKGYLVKDRGCDELAKAIRTLAQGGKYIPGEIKEIYLDRKSMPDLTKREKEALDLMCAGHSNDDIARLMGITHSSAKQHLKHIFEKMGVSSRVEAMSEAIRRGFVSAPANRG